MRYLIALLLMVPITLSVSGTPRTSLAAPPDAKKKQLPNDAAMIAETLQERFDVENRLEAVKFKDVVHMFEERLGVTIILDNYLSVGGHADSPGPLDEVENQPITVPKMTKVRANTVLKYVCNLVGANYVIEGDHIKIVARNNHEVVVGGLPALPQLYPIENAILDTVISESNQVMQNKLTATWEQVSLSDVLKTINARTNRTVVLSASAQPQANSKISLTLDNVLPEIAVALVAEVAGLHCVMHGNATILVSADRYKQIRDIEEKSNRRQQFGTGGFATTTDVEQIRRETEQLKEAIEKLTEKLTK